MSICAEPLCGGGSFVSSQEMNRYPMKLSLSEASVRTAAERSPRGAPSRDIGSTGEINQGVRVCVVPGRDGESSGRPHRGTGKLDVPPERSHSQRIKSRVEWVGRIGFHAGVF